MVNYSQQFKTLIKGKNKNKIFTTCQPNSKFFNCRKKKQNKKPTKKTKLFNNSNK